MQVINRVFFELIYLWFSNIYGRFNENILLFGLNQNSKFVENASKYPVTDKKRLLFGKPFINEFQITDEIVKLLGLTTTNKGYVISNKENIKQFIYSHDNFIFYIEPINDVLVQKSSG
jgi:hypothetical protein